MDQRFPSGQPADQTVLTVPDDGPIEPVEPGPTTRKGRSRNSAGLVNVALGVALVVAVGGIAFAAGQMTAPATAGPIGGGQFGNRGYFPPDGNLPGGGGAAGGVRPGGTSLEGTVESVSGTTLTLKLASGQTVQVSLADTTTYHAQTSAASTDVTSGDTVLVRVDGFRPDQAGSGGAGLTANDITIVP